MFRSRPRVGEALPCLPSVLSLSARVPSAFKASTPCYTLRCPNHEQRATPGQPAPLPSELYDEAYFLTACEGYDEFLRTEGEHLSRRLRQAFAFAAVEAGMTVLDIGCGRGEIVRHVVRIGARGFGIDYAQAAVRLSQRTMHNETGVYGIARANARHLPFADAQFDRVLMFDVVEHLQPWELEVTLQEAKRVLKPGGQIVIHTAPNRWYDVYAYPLVRTVRTIMGQGSITPEPARFERCR